MKYLFSVLSALSICSAALAGNHLSFILLSDSNSLLLAPGSKLILVSGRFSFTEGPAVDKSGNIYFTDQPNNSIWKYDVKGKLSLFLKPSGRSNGMYFDRKGNLVTCADGQNEMWLISMAKKKKLLLTDFHGKHFNGPNDLWIDKQGGIYFTDPYYQRDYWTRKSSELSGQYIYYLAPNAKQAVIFDSTLVQPNGIVGSPDGKFLFVADIGGNKTYKFRIQSGGQNSGRELFVEQGSDGITLDELGNLYLTGNGVTVFNPTGKQIFHLDVPAKWTANLCFGGHDRRTLFITASESVYTINMRVRGVE